MIDLWEKENSAVLKADLYWSWKLKRRDKHLSEINKWKERDFIILLLKWSDKGFGVLRLKQSLQLKKDLQGSEFIKKGVYSCSIVVGIYKRENAMFMFFNKQLCYTDISELRSQACLKYFAHFVPGNSQLSVIAIKMQYFFVPAVRDSPERFSRGFLCSKIWL